MYGLKKQFICEWDRYYVAYDNVEQSKAFESVSLLLKWESGDAAKISTYLPKMTHSFDDRSRPILD